MMDRKTALKNIGLVNLGQIYWNLPTPALYEEAIWRHEGMLSHMGPLAIKTAPYTGRLPKDKFIVREPSSADKIWWGKVNQAFEPVKFEALRNRVCAYLQGKTIFIQDGYAGADERYRVPIRVISERPSAALFARTMFIREENPEVLERHVPEFTVLHAPDFYADPEVDGTRSDAFILLHFAERLILIGGTAYCGEIKKSIFTVMNYLLPQKGVMAMHASANYGKDENDVAIFFGLSGTGKTTLSASRDRTLIGDDEHGWSDDGVFNFEGGCYAKMIRLSKEGEPEIFATSRTFGTLLENVVIDPATRAINLDDDSITENTRGSYLISQIPNMTLKGKGGHPKNIIMLTCDAFGVLPPISRLTPNQAVFHFLTGYTAKVAGTETGITKPEATFSPCFGAPFMALPPTVYANLLGRKIMRHNVDVWLINTGWTGGRYGEGKRIKLAFTRAMVKAVLDGTLKEVPTEKDPIFDVCVPVTCAGVPQNILIPRNTWSNSQSYDSKAKELAAMFKENIKEYESQVIEVRTAEPILD